MTPRWRKPSRSLLFVVVCLLAGAVRGQSVPRQYYNHATLWTRLVVSKTFTPHWSVQGEVHVRRQNNYLISRLNPLTNPYFNGYRLLLSYRKGPWTFQLNPNYFKSYQLLGKKADFSSPRGQEFRFAAYAEWARTWNRSTLRVRSGYEYRLLERLAYQPTARFRLRVQGRQQLSDRSAWILGTEPLLNVGPNAAPTWFNQNQAYTGFTYRLTSHLSTEAGYLYVFRQRQSRVEYDNEHALNLVLRMDL